MTELYRAVEIKDGESVEPVQFLGVYALRWPSTRLGAPTIGFVEVDRATAELESADTTLADFRHMRAVLRFTAWITPKVTVTEIVKTLDNIIIALEKGE